VLKELQGLKVLKVPLEYRVLRVLKELQGLKVLRVL
jgi:hypothetical protein